MAVTVKEVSGAELEGLITGGKVLVDFYSKNCGPCKMLKFVLNDVAKEVEDAEIVTLDFDENKEAVEKFQVKGYPTLLVFSNGVETGRVQGLQQKPVILKMIKES